MKQKKQTVQLFHRNVDKKYEIISKHEYKYFKKHKSFDNWSNIQKLGLKKYELFNKVGTKGNIELRYSGKANIVVADLSQAMNNPNDTNWYKLFAVLVMNDIYINAAPMYRATNRNLVRPLVVDEPANKPYKYNQAETSLIQRISNSILGPRTLGKVISHDKIWQVYTGSDHRDPTDIELNQVTMKKASLADAKIHPMSNTYKEALTALYNKLEIVTFYRLNEISIIHGLKEHLRFIDFNGNLMSFPLNPSQFQSIKSMAKEAFDSAKQIEETKQQQAYAESLESIFNPECSNNSFDYLDDYFQDDASVNPYANFPDEIELANYIELHTQNNITATIKGEPQNA